MAINNFFDNSDINIYFHMKNHYRKLKSARSTIDNSFPQSCVKTFSTPPASGRSLKRANFEERPTKNDLHSHNSSTFSIKERNCTRPGSVSGFSNISINTVDLSERPKTRRNPFEYPFKMKYKQTPQQSMSSTGKKRTTCFNKTKKKMILEKYLDVGSHRSDSNNIMEKPTIDQQKNENNAKNDLQEIQDRNKFRVEEHEYLQFLLRITEDIIINNLYKNEDIERVFEAHIEANKDRLNVEKMESQLARLCVELEIPYKSNESNLKHLQCFGNFFDQHMYVPNFDKKLENCECTTKRTLNIETGGENTICPEKKQSTKYDIQTMFNILSNKYSLGRVTECTEPSASLDTIIGSMKKLSVSGSGHINTLPCLENVEVDNENSKDEPFENDAFCKVAEKSLHTDMSLTEKEKLGCMEEEILFEKYNHNIVNTVEDTNLNELGNQNNANITKSEGTNNNIFGTGLSTVVNISEQTVIAGIIDMVKEKSGTYLNVTDSDVKKFIEKITYLKDVENAVPEDLNCQSFENSEKSSLTKCSNNQKNPATGDEMLMTDNIQNKLKIVVFNPQSFENTEGSDNTSSASIKCNENKKNCEMGDVLFMTDVQNKLKVVTLSCQNFGNADTVDDVSSSASIQSNNNQKNSAEGDPMYVLNTVQNSSKIINLNSQSFENAEKDVASPLIKANKKQNNCTNGVLMMDNTQNSIKVLTLSSESHKNAPKSDSYSSTIKFSENIKNGITKDIVFIADNIQDNLKVPNEFKKLSQKATNDQGTQIEVTCCDKECNTSIILDNLKSDYVLLNGPIYVLKAILNSENKFIVYNKDNNREEIILTQEDNSEELRYGKVSCSKSVQHCGTIPIFDTKTKLNYDSSHTEDYSKLLNSDYDLMPQRDSNISNKYHHLLRDASTSISNITMEKTLNSTYADCGALLLGDKYELTSHLREDNLIPEMDIARTHSVLEKNSVHLQKDGQYYLKDNSLSREANNSHKNLDYSLNSKTEAVLSEQKPELDVSLTNYELFSQGIIHESNNIGRDVSEYGEIVRPTIIFTDTDEDFSQPSTFRSNKEINSSTSSPNKGNILGKRKLKHPS